MSHLDKLTEVVAEIDAFQAESAKEMAAHGASSYRANLDVYFEATFKSLLRRLQIHAVAFANDFGPIASSRQYSYEVAGREGPKHLALPIYTWNRETGHFEDDPNGKAKLWAYQGCREHEATELGVDPWFIQAFRSAHEFKTEAEQKLGLLTVREGEYSTNLLLWRLQEINKRPESIPESWFAANSGISLAIPSSRMVERLLRQHKNRPSDKELLAVGLVGSTRTVTVCDELELLGLGHPSDGDGGRLIGTERLFRMIEWLSHSDDAPPELRRTLPNLSAVRIGRLGLLESPNGKPIFLKDLRLEGLLRGMTELAASAAPIEQTARFPLLSHYVNRTNEHISRCWFVFPIPFSPLALSSSENPASAYILGTFADTIVEGSRRKVLDEEEFVAHLRVTRLLLSTFYQNTLGLELAATYYSVLAREEEVATLRHAVNTTLGEIVLRAETVDMAIRRNDSERAIKSVADLRKSIGRMQDRVRALRRFSTAKLKLEASDPSAIFRDVLSTIRNGGCDLLNHNKIVGISRGDPSLSVLADVELLKYIFEVLWRNSIEAANMSPTPGDLECVLTVQPAPRAPGLLRLEFNDNGPGMPKDGRRTLQESIRMFQPFSTKPELSGRGLLDVKRIVQRHIAEARVRLPIFLTEVEILKPVSNKGFRLSFLLPEGRED